MNLMAAGAPSITSHSRQEVEGRWKVTHGTFRYLHSHLYRTLQVVPIMSYILLVTPSWLQGRLRNEVF